jgi:hypothetical protein
VLINDPLFAGQARLWRDNYWNGLVRCSKGDLPGANEGLAPAFQAASKMVQIASR